MLRFAEEIILLLLNVAEPSIGTGGPYGRGRLAPNSGAILGVQVNFTGKSVTADQGSRGPHNGDAVVHRHETSVKV